MNLKKPKQFKKVLKINDIKKCSQMEYIFMNIKFETFY